MKKDIETRSEEGRGQEPSRRKLLKALTAGGAAAAVMPTEWTKPALKSVVLPAHAQTTGIAGCGIQGWAFVSAGPDTTCFCMSANVKADNSCSGPALVRLFNSSGSQVAVCTSTMDGAPTASMSCSVSSETPPIGEGELVTFVADLTGGCTCTFVTTSQ